MIKSCSKMDSCPFFVKFNQHAKGFKHLYCEGPLMAQCARITYKAEKGVRPPDNMAPTGVLFSSEGS